MRSRFPLLLKKRGRRRTGSPLLAASGHLAAQCVLLAVGLGGAAAMVREPSAWPRWALIVPVSLCIVGAFGLWRTLQRAGASAEALRWRAERPWRFDRAPAKSPPLPLPLVEGANDSPGIRLRYRLPIDGAGAWRIVGMGLICLLWNGLVGFFLVEIITHLIVGPVNWPVTLLVAPLAFAGVGLAYELLRDAWSATGAGGARVEVAQLPLALGGRCAGVVIQGGPLKVRSLVVLLVCQEVATYLQGTDARTATVDVYRQTLLRERRFEIASERAFEAGFEITIPADAMHSFRSAHNEVAWWIEVRCLAQRSPAMRRRFPLCVYPPAAPKPPQTEPISAEPLEIKGV